jgi:hypothetical protein
MLPLFRGFTLLQRDFTVFFQLFGFSEGLLFYKEILRFFSNYLEEFPFSRIFHFLRIYWIFNFLIFIT